MVKSSESWVQNTALSLPASVGRLFKLFKSQSPYLKTGYEQLPFLEITV